jgi:hypothetical protein
MLQRLACYLRENPLAGDTQEGIAQWWLGLDPSSLELLDRALHWLTCVGILEAVRAADGRVRYRRVSLTAAVDARLDRLIAGDGTAHQDPNHLT